MLFVNLILLLKLNKFYIPIVTLIILDHEKENNLSRRDFLKNSALMGAVGTLGAGAAATAALTSCGGGKTESNVLKPLKEAGTYYVPELTDMAIDGQELKSRCNRMRRSRIRSSHQFP